MWQRILFCSGQLIICDVSMLHRGSLELAHYGPPRAPWATVGHVMLLGPHSLLIQAMLKPLSYCVIVIWALA